MESIAVIGAGIAGLAAARSLAASGLARVTLFEAEPRFGGHAHTVDITLHGRTHGVDTGFLVCTEATYPGLTGLFRELQVSTAPAEMSLSVQLRDRGIEWSGRSAASLFAQPSNLARPAFLGMLAEIPRFNRVFTRLATDSLADDDEEPLQAFLDRHRFGRLFREAYLLPMVGCIWSCPVQEVLQFPVGFLARFCHGHGLLRLAGRPQWRSVVGGSREYVRRMVERLPDARSGTPVLGVLRQPSGVLLKTAAGTERFDGVVFACHTDQALRLLGQDATIDERRLLGAIRYRRNRSVLHTDASVLPRHRRAWSAWNHDAASTGGEDAVCLHYLLNRLQPLPWAQPVLVTLNPRHEPAGLLREFSVDHPVPDRAAVRAQRQIGSLQGQRGSWFCGAWTGHGFHEDGLSSGLRAADRVIEELSHRRAAAA